MPLIGLLLKSGTHSGLSAPLVWRWQTATLLLLLPIWAVGQAQTPVLVKASQQVPVVGTNVPDPTLADRLAKPAGADNVPTALPARTVDPRIIPLFGERSKTPRQIEDEINFLTDCDQNFSSRQEASRFFTARGWEYIAEARLDTAAYRFNLAFLADDKNPDVYWGLGVVSYQRGQLTEAVRLLTRGVALADTNAVILTDLATVELEQYQAKADTASLTDAREHLQKALFLNPANAPAYAKLSIASYLQADYRTAWTYLHKAYRIDLAIIDLTYVQELLAKEPDPTGVFK